MNSSATKCDRISIPPKHFTLVERVFAIANKHRASSDLPRILEKWIDDRDIEEGFHWNRREHPAYQLTFTQCVRGQPLRVFVDYCANSDFLGVFIYWPTKLTPDAVEEFYKVVNRINWDIPYGNLELDPSTGSLRFRIAVDVEGVRLTPGFLNFMLESGLRVIDQHITKVLPGPIGLVA